MMKKVWSTTQDGVTVTVHRVPRGRFTLQVSREDAPGQGRIHLALSLAHVVRLLRLHGPGRHLDAA
jgi:hypothetical protein